MALERAQRETVPVPSGKRKRSQAKPTRGAR